MTRSARSPSGIGGTPATVALTRAGIDYIERPYRHDPAAASYGLEAAAALGTDPDRVLKTLLVRVETASAAGGTALVVAVVSVAGSLDLKALAAAVGGKRAGMADPAEAERATGYVVGGISPFGQRRAHPTVVDEGALAHPTVLVSGGRRGLDLEVRPGDLVRLTGARVASLRR